jgi:hypothetical protein
LSLCSAIRGSRNESVADWKAVGWADSAQQFAAFAKSASQDAQPSSVAHFAVVDRDLEFDDDMSANRYSWFERITLTVLILIIVGLGYVSLFMMGAP